ncbi:hypothetical protein CTI10_024000 [Delftia acidovorans]|uniref:RHS protein conserved region domain-containing protein n=1 Tax=Chryseobacterium sp. B5 TaxID=2050562 RepID=A0A2G7T5U6_9FLAO|nr:hypothetical protein CTI10_024000 [Delftia acidovorans]
MLGQYVNQRSANSAAPAGQNDSTEIIYLPTASGPMPIAAEINGRLYAIHTDHLSTPRRLTNQQGQVAWQWLISGFGEVRPNTGNRGYGQTVSGPSYAQAVKFDLRYPGQVFDEETGLSYNLHRYYDAATGRYIQADPIGLEGGWNRFGYVGGDPLGASDPMGLMPQCRWLGLVMHCSNVNHPIPGYENPSNPPWSWGNGGITENMGVPRPSDMTRLEERQWDRHCNGNPDPCGSLKNAVRIAIGMAMTKKKNMELDPSGLFGTIGWGTHATDLAGRIGNINAMIGLGEKLSCDMSQEKILAQTIYIPNRPFK